MGQTEYKIFIVLATIILLVFINGIIIFIFQYRKRKMAYDKEKEMIAARHTQDLLSTQLKIQEQTMQDIGREIHDNVGQRLTLASIYANQLAYENKYPQINERIEAISSIINESLSELRSLSKSLANSNEQVGELVELVQNECNRVNGLKTCTASCSFNDTGFMISTTVKNFILRIIQEFTQNSLKHAGCRNIFLSFTYTDAGLTVSANDDGAGFDSQAYRQNPDKGIGLLNMRKRAELIGADFSIESELSQGTKLNLFIPVNKLNTH